MIEKTFKNNFIIISFNLGRHYMGSLRLDNYEECMEHEETYSFICDGFATMTLNKRTIKSIKQITPNEIAIVLEYQIPMNKEEEY